MPSSSSPSSLDSQHKSPQKRFLEGLQDQRKAFSDQHGKSSASYAKYRGISSSTPLSGYQRSPEGIRGENWLSVPRPTRWENVSDTVVLGDQLILTGSRKGAPRSVTELFQAHRIDADSNIPGDSEPIAFNQAEVSRVNDLLREKSVAGNGSEELSLHMHNEDGRLVCQVLWDGKELTRCSLISCEGKKLHNDREKELKKPETLSSREKGALFNRRGREKKQKFAQQYGVPEEEVLWGKVDELSRDIPLLPEENEKSQLIISRSPKNGHLTICLDGEVLLDSGMAVSSMDYLVANPSPQSTTVMITAGTQVIAFTYDKENKKILQQKNFISGKAFDQHDFHLEGIRLREDRFSMMPVGRDLMLFELHREQRPQSTQFTNSHQLKAVFREKVSLPFPVKSYQGKFPGNHEDEEILLFKGENDEDLLVFWQKGQAQIGEVLPVLHWTEDEQGRLWYLPAGIDSSEKISLGTIQLSQGEEDLDLAHIWDQIDSQKDQEELLGLFRSLNLLKNMLDQSAEGEENMEQITNLLQKCEEDLKYYSERYSQISDFDDLHKTVTDLLQPLQGYNEESFQETERKRREDELEQRVTTLQTEFGGRIEELSSPTASIERILEIKTASERVQAELTTIYRERGQEIPADHPVLKGRFELEQLRVQNEVALMGDARVEVAKLGKELENWKEEVMEAKELSEGSPILVAVVSFRDRLKVLEQIRDIPWSTANADFENELWEITRFEDAQDIGEDSSLRERLEWTNELLKKTHFELTCSDEKKKILSAYRSLQERARQRLRDAKHSTTVASVKERLRKDGSELKQRISSLEGLRDDLDCRQASSDWNRFLDEQCRLRESTLQSQEVSERARLFQICKENVNDFRLEMGQSTSMTQARALIEPYRALFNRESSLAEVLKGPLLTEGYPQSSASLGSLQQDTKRFCEQGGDALIQSEKLWQEASEIFQAQMRQFQQQAEMIDEADPNTLHFAGSSLPLFNPDRAARVASGVPDTAPLFRVEESSGVVHLAIEGYKHPAHFISDYADVKDHLGWETAEHSQGELLAHLIAHRLIRVRWESLKAHVLQGDAQEAEMHIAISLKNALKKKKNMKIGFPNDEVALQDTAKILHTLITAGLEMNPDAMTLLECIPTEKKELPVKNLSGQHASILSGEKTLDLTRLFSHETLWDEKTFKAISKMNRKWKELYAYLRKELCLDEKAGAELFQASDRSGQFEVTPLVEQFLEKIALEYGLFLDGKKVLSIIEGDYGFGKTTLLEKLGHLLGMRVCVIDCTKLVGENLNTFNPFDPNLSPDQRREMMRAYAAARLGNCMIIFDEAHALDPREYPSFWVSWHQLADKRQEFPASAPDLDDPTEYESHPLRKRFDRMRKFEAVHSGGKLPARVWTILMKNTKKYNDTTKQFETYPVSVGVSDRAGKGINLDNLIKQEEQAFMESYLQLGLSQHPLLAADAAGMSKELMSYSLDVLAGEDTQGLIQKHGLEGAALASDPERLEGIVRNSLRVAEVLTKIYMAREDFLDNPHDPQEPPFTAAVSYRGLEAIMGDLNKVHTQDELDQVLIKHPAIDSALSEQGDAHQHKLNTLRVRVEILGDSSAIAEWEKLKREYEGRRIIQSAETPEGVMAAAQVRLVETLSALPGEIVKSLTTDPAILAVISRPSAPSAEEIAQVVSKNIQRAVGSVLSDAEMRAEIGKAVIAEFKGQIPAGMQPIVSALAKAFAEKN